ncbi:TonB-dependent receptor [Compostibacter hankyongensis]|uniref:TonB-dependent receptor n=2 Tax=Compostibacter hankyongensis TaxID=1007089 RepID=A0ABP8FJY1_9BACT
MQSQAQQQQVSGRVTDETGAAVQGATVSVRGTAIGAATGADGRYSLSVPDTATLTFSFTGYQTQQIPVNGKKTINITLVADLNSLNEVVVVGYGAQKRADVVGSVTSVSGDKIANIPVPNVSNAISGRLPGATVMQGNGEPGQNGAKIMVRGRTTLGKGEITDPLVVIDGIPGRALNEIDPSDIESISLLKDASAAIYGAQAANGVILVTTKRGTTGKPRLNYSFYQGFMTPTRLPKALSAGDYATMLSEYQDYEGRPRTFSDEDIALFYNGKDPWEHPNTNWVDELVSKWTTTSRHDITLDGGTGKMNYYLSVGYRNEEAIYKQQSTNYHQYNLRGKLDIPITDWLKASADYAGFIIDKYYPTKSAAEIYGQSMRLLPTQWAFWPSGEPGPDLEYGDNPVVTSTLQGGYNDNKSYKNELTLKLSITPPMIKGLTIDGYYSMDIYNRYQKIFRKPWTLYFPNWDEAVRNDEGYITSMELSPAKRGYTEPELQENYERILRRLGNINFTYSRKFGDHSLSLFGAYEQMREDTNNIGAFRKHYISDIIQTINAGSLTDRQNSGTTMLYARESWIGRLNYNYKDKYLAEVLFRMDGSLKFPPDSRWGAFPAVLLGWRASEERFWKDNIRFINYFKLRASYGKMGMDPGDPFQYMNKYVLNTGLALGDDKAIETTVFQQGVANPNITWEKQTTYNVGFDSKFLEDKFYLNADFFYNERSDILAPRSASVPAYTGLALPDENIAKVDNRGFELEAGYQQQVSKDFNFSVGGNMSYSHNRVIFTDEPKRSVPWQQRTGHPYGATLLYRAIGVFADDAAVENYPHWTGAGPGDIIFEDVNKDGKITSDDRILLDRTDAPELFYGITLDAQYKNWTFSLLVQGQGSYYRYNYADQRRGEAGNYFQWNFDNRWTPENTHTDIPRAYNRVDQYWGFQVNDNTYWYANMAYCRLKNAMLSYTLPNNLLHGIGVSRANIYVAASNLLMLYSAQKNFDPEISSPIAYPTVKTFAIGAQVTFQ